MGIYLAKRRKHLYKYRSYYDKGKRRQEYLGRADWLEVLLWKILQKIKKFRK